ncbi:hypothetical protein G9A89_022672 [Geosiphon pyriformis]|nr:hypothetical protein G9A89_022672 [Geosiphon pyriformis]
MGKHHHSHYHHKKYSKSVYFIKEILGERTAETGELELKLSFESNDVRPPGWYSYKKISGQLEELWMAYEAKKPIISPLQHRRNKFRASSSKALEDPVEKRPSVFDLIKRNGEQEAKKHFAEMKKVFGLIDHIFFKSSDNDDIEGNDDDENDEKGDYDYDYDVFGI